MKVVFTAWDHDPNTFEWPVDDHGRHSFKLDRLAPANGFTNHDAHDALGDVEATIHIATLIRDRAPAVWAQCLRNRDKAEIRQRLQTGQPLSLTERFGAAPPRSYFGVYAGTNPQNQNSLAFLDLDICDASILDAEYQVLAKAITGSPKLIRTIATNKTPNLFPIAHPSDAHNNLAHQLSHRVLIFRDEWGKLWQVDTLIVRNPRMLSNKSMAGSTAQLINDFSRPLGQPIGNRGPKLLDSLVILGSNSSGCA